MMNAPNRLWLWWQEVLRFLALSILSILQVWEGVVEVTFTYKILRENM